MICRLGNRSVDFSWGSGAVFVVAYKRHCCERTKFRIYKLLWGHLYVTVWHALRITESMVDAIAKENPTLFQSRGWADLPTVPSKSPSTGVRS